MNFVIIKNKFSNYKIINKTILDYQIEEAINLDLKIIVLNKFKYIKNSIFINQSKFIFKEELKKIKEELLINKSKNIKSYNINNNYNLLKFIDVLTNKINSRFLKNGVIIGKNTIISSDSEVKNSYIFNSIIINSKINNSNIINSYIIDSKIINSNVGPFSVIRNESFLNKALIGNFVEVKKSNINEETKIKHLSYIGDSFIGRNVNIGCGVITVNYDGLNKFKTYIDDYSFIGSNSNLIAPLKLGKNSFVACGTTLNKNLNDYDFSISRSKLIIKKEYKKK